MILYQDGPNIQPIVDYGGPRGGNYNSLDQPQPIHINNLDHQSSPREVE